MVTCLDLLQRIIVVNVLGSIVKIDEYLSIPVGEKSVDRVRVFYPFEINEKVNELVERENWYMRLKDHRRVRLLLAIATTFDLFNAGGMASAFEVSGKPGFDNLFKLVLRCKAGG